MGYSYLSSADIILANVILILSIFLQGEEDIHRRPIVLQRGNVLDGTDTGTRKCDHFQLDCRRYVLHVIHNAIFAGRALSQRRNG